MKRNQILLLLVVALLLLVPTAMSQEDAGSIEPQDADMMNAAAHISFPPPVYVVRDSVDIRGTVTLETMRNFFIEFRPLVLDMMMDEDEDNPWRPATLPRIEVVEDDVLGTWNTSGTADGLYELRLAINTGGDMPEYYRVSPVRVENSPPSFAAEQPMMEVVDPADDMAEMDDDMEDMDDDMEDMDDDMEDMDDDMAGEPEPEPTPDPRPRVIATVNSNVRSGDSTVYGVIGYLLDGESALIKGLSSRGTGWYYIELANGRSGFIFPGIVNAEGDLSNLPRINPPPPPPPTPIPQPTAPPPPPQPQSNIDLVFHKVVIHPHGVKCGETYRIDVEVRNAGGGAATNGGYILVRDAGQGGAAEAQTTEIAFPPVAPGAVVAVFGHITPTLHVETHHNINLHLDGHNNVHEINEGNNHHATAPYFLSSGC